MAWLRHLFIVCVSSAIFIGWASVLIGTCYDILIVKYFEFTSGYPHREQTGPPSHFWDLRASEVEAYEAWIKVPFTRCHKPVVNLGITSRRKGEEEEIGKAEHV